LNFLDEAVIHVQGGNGGNGCSAFRREKFVPLGGPSGGDGGKGGSVSLRGKEGQNTLYHLRNRSIYSAKRGGHGEGSNKTGRSGDDLVVEVPLGTQAYDVISGELVGEVLEHGQEIVVAKGGDGGRGNARFKTATNQAPRRKEPGWPGVDRRLRLELKLLADVGVVGLPNAGKSTLLSVISSARPKVADYPFTTLVPQLGVVADGPLDDPFVVADLPGLIAGAAQGAGLGIRFLKHIERCRVLVHVVDLSAEGDGDVVEDLETTEHELASFSDELLERSRLIVGSKIDSAVSERQEALRQAASERGLQYCEISSVTGDGLKPFVREVRTLLASARLEYDD